MANIMPDIPVDKPQNVGPNGGPNNMLSLLAQFHEVLDAWAHDLSQGWALDPQDTEAPEGTEEQLQTLKRQVKLLEFDNVTLKVLLYDAKDGEEEVICCNDVLANYMWNLLVEIPALQAQITSMEGEICNYKAQIADLEAALQAAKGQAEPLAEAATIAFQDLNRGSG